MKTGLIMEGGAMRGMFTAGVTDILMDSKISFDGAIGVSAGAVFGCNYKSRQIGRSIRYNMKYSRDWRYCSMRSLIQTGDLFGAEFCYLTIPQQLHSTQSHQGQQGKGIQPHDIPLKTQCPGTKAIEAAEKSNG